MGENGITISSQGKEIKADFEDADLMSEEEKAAMAEDIPGELEANHSVSDDADAAAAEAVKQINDQEAEDNAKKEAEIAAADEKIAAEKEKAGEGESDTKTADEKTAEKAGEGSADDASADQGIIVPQAQPPVMMDVMSQEEVDQVTADLAASKQKFQDGEIDYDAYFDERLKLERALWQNDVAVQLSTDGVENQWQWEQNTFLSDQGNSWIADDDVVFSAFAATVNRIMATDEGSVLPGNEILDQAREEVAKRFSPTQEADTQAAADDKAGKAALAAAKKAQADKAIPETLASVPAAEAEEGTGEFGYIDKLDGEAFEKAVEALSPAQLSRYENQV